MSGRPQMPPITEYDRDLIELLFDIGPVVPLGMGGHTTISEADIGWYRLNRRAKLTAYECKTLKDLSAIYAQALNEASEKHAPAPWRPVEIDRKAVADGMKAWAEQMKSLKGSGHG